jgi:hypothetical protein
MDAFESFVRARSRAVRVSRARQISVPAVALSRSGASAHAPRRGGHARPPSPMSADQLLTISSFRSFPRSSRARMGLRR